MVVPEPIRMPEPTIVVLGWKLFMGIAGGTSGGNAVIAGAGGGFGAGEGMAQPLSVARTTARPSPFRFIFCSKAQARFFLLVKMISQSYNVRQDKKTV